MKETDLSKKWAWSQVEAMADGSLEPGERRRMRRLMKADPSLEDAVQRARRIRAELRRLDGARVPPRLGARLAAIAAAGRTHASRKPLARPRTSFERSLLAGAALAAAAIAVATALLSIQPAPPPSQTPEAALRDLSAAMQYMRRGAVITKQGVAREVGQGIIEALDIGRSAVGGHSEPEKGG
jgi:anti-sigma factor RsiW